MPDEFRLPPDWVIEFLSPDQSPNRVIGTILDCLESGCQLGWLIDPCDRSILVLHSNTPPQLLSDNDPLPVVQDIPLTITVTTVFSWLILST